MSMFKSEKLIPVSLPDLEPVANELAGHFKQRDYQVEYAQLPSGEWQVGITRGGVFKAAVGLKSALKIQIEAYPSGTMVRAGAGIFGKQALPTTITLLVAWPVVLTQVWGLIREANLDDEAVSVVEASLMRHQRVGSFQDVPASPAGSPGPQRAATSPAQSAFCTSCGEELGVSARFCALCGQAVSPG